MLITSNYFLDNAPKYGNISYGLYYGVLFMNKIEMLALKARQKLNDNISFNSIEKYLKTLGCIVLFYGNNCDDFVLDVIGQRGYSKTVSAFTYKSHEIKMIFINLDNKLT